MSETIPSLVTSTGAMTVLVTNGGTHSAESWAEVVAQGLVKIDPSMPAERLEQAVSVRVQVKAALVDVFHEATATMTVARAAEISGQMLNRMADIFAGTTWAMTLEHPEIRTQIQLHIYRNLMSAAEIALRTE